VKNGQLGTEVPLRSIFIWEGAVATLPGGRVIRDLEWIKRRMGLFDQAVRYWQLNGPTINQMWSMLATTGMRIDVCVTSRQPEFAMAVARLMERQNLPARYVFSETAAGLGRKLPTMPDVWRVYYGLEEQRWAFGPHGVGVATHSSP
jgi:hypothetical protein